MDSNQTPSKSNYRSMNSNSFKKRTPEHYQRSPPLPTHDLAAIKESQYLMNQMRTLQAKNRSMASEIEQFRYESNMNESKYIQKINSNEESLSQFHREKAYQFDLIQVKHEEDLTKVRRQYQFKIDELVRQINHKDYQIKERDDQLAHCHIRINELSKDCQSLSRQLQGTRQELMYTNENLKSQNYQCRQLQALVQNLTVQKNQMQTQIKILLDIEAEKAHTINQLEGSLKNSQQNCLRLTDKLGVLNDNFHELEKHIAIMKDKLLSTESENEKLHHQLNQCQFQLANKEKIILEQNEHQHNLRRELQDHQIRERKREKEVNELMNENEKLYKDLNINKHRLHEVGIAYGIQI